MSDSDSSESDDSILNEELPFSQTSTASAGAAAAHHAGGGDGGDGSNATSPVGQSRCGGAGGSNATTSMSTSSPSYVSAGPSTSKQTQHEIPEGEIERRAHKKASNAMLPRDITAPSQLFWHKTTTKGVQKYYPCCQTTNSDIAAGLMVPQNWDPTKKTFIHYFRSACLSMGEYSVVSTSTLVPFHGDKVATEDGNVIGQWCPQLCSAYETQMKKELKKAGENELNIGVLVRSHQIFLDKILEKAKALEEETTKSATAKQKKISKTGPADAMSGNDIDEMLLARSASETEESSSDDDGAEGICERKTELIRPGDVIEYTDTMAVQGDKNYRKTCKVLSVDPRRNPILVLENGDFLPPETPVKRIKKRYRGELLDDDKAYYKPINDFKLSKASLAGAEGVAAGIKKEAQRVGGIISKNMAELQEKAQADGFAPMDLMNRYKGAPAAAVAVAAADVGKSRKRSLDIVGSEHFRQSKNDKD